MRVIRAANVNQALSSAVGMMINESDRWLEISPRGNVTREWPEPVATVYSRPWQRVLFSAVRDANPFFHLMESLWMLAGRSDARWLSTFSSKISQFAESNGHFHGAYGQRWRESFYLDSPDDYFSFETDQLLLIAKLFAEDPNTRRAVLTMWNPEIDLGAQKKDLPCNTHIYFKLRAGKLNMLVSCRSNDLILGCYGANVVHFSVLQEYVASMIGAHVGTYTHVSDSWHYYVDNPFAKLMMDGVALDRRDYYSVGGGPQTAAIALVNGAVARWDEDLKVFMSEDWHEASLYKDAFFQRVAYPMRSAHEAYTRDDLETAAHLANQIASPDWRMACCEWLDRRAQRRVDHSRKVEVQS